MDTKFNTSEAKTCLKYIIKFKLRYSGLFKAQSKSKLGVSAGIAEDNDIYYLVLYAPSPISFISHIASLFKKQPSYDAIKNELKPYLESIKDGSNLIITGHSKSGKACPHIVTWIKLTFGNKFNTKVYAFACPPTKDLSLKNLAETSATHSYSTITNPLDPFPYIEGNIGTLLDKAEEFNLPFLYKKALSVLNIYQKIQNASYEDIGRKVSLPKKSFPEYTFSIYQQLLYFEFLAIENHSALYHKILLDDEDIISLFDRVY